jgi:hypothetical protein
MRDRLISFKHRDVGYEGGRDPLPAPAGPGAEALPSRWFLSSGAPLGSRNRNYARGDWTTEMSSNANGLVHVNQIEKFRRLRHGGSQFVNEGGQAVIGNVKPAPKCS